MSKKRAAWLVLLMLLFAATTLFVATPPAEAFNCKIVSCPVPICLEGEHLYVPPGQCCPICVPD